MSKITIAIDTLGGDNGAEPMIKGINDAIKIHDDVNIIVTGKEDELNPLIDKYSVPKEKIEVIHANEIITCHDAPVDAIRRKKDSSRDSLRKFREQMTHQSLIKNQIRSQIRNLKRKNNINLFRC